MGLFGLFKKKENSNELEQSYLAVNINKFNYTDGIMKDRLESLQGEIKEITQFSYEVVKGKLVLENSTSVFSLRFDRFKKIIEEKTYRSEEEISSHTFYENGKILSVLRFFNGKNLTSKDEYKYNDSGECVFYKEYRYDNDGKEIYSSRIFLDINDNSFKKEIFENGISRTELFNKNFYNPLSPPNYENLGDQGYRQIIQLHDSKTIDTFDKFKNFVTSQRFDKDGILQVEIKVTYDNEFKRKTYSQYNYMDKTKIITNYHYDSNGYLIKLEINNSDNITFENDLYGNIVKKFTNWNKSIPEEEYEYEYDSEGNWTKRTMKYREKIFNIRTRKIEYYQN